MSKSEELKSAVKKLQAAVLKLEGSPAKKTNAEYVDELLKFADVLGDDWDPLDHPHDPHTGKWVKKGHGVFGKHPHVAHKGVFTSSFGHQIHYEVPEGSKAFKAASGGYALVVHPDTSHTTHHDNGEVIHHEAGSHKVLIEKANSGKLEELHHHLQPEEPKTQAQKETAESVSHNKKEMTEALAKLKYQHVVVEVGNGKKVTLNKNQQAYKADTGTLITTNGVPTIYSSHVTGEYHSLSEAAKPMFVKHIKKENLIADGSGSPGPQPDKLGTHPNVQGNVFTHPVTGTTHELKPGDTLHQHNKVKESFVILHPDKSGTKIDKTGKASKQAAGNKQINESVVNKNYTHIGSHQEIGSEEDVPDESFAKFQEEQFNQLGPKKLASAIDNLAQKVVAEKAKEQQPEPAEKTADPFAATASADMTLGGHNVHIEPGDIVFQDKKNAFILRMFHSDGTHSTWSGTGQLVDHAAPTGHIGSVEDWEKKYGASSYHKLDLSAVKTAVAPTEEVKKEEPKVAPKAPEKSKIPTEPTTIKVGKSTVPWEPGDTVLQGVKNKSYVVIYHMDGTVSQNENVKIGTTGFLAHKAKVAPPEKLATPEQAIATGIVEAYDPFGPKPKKPTVSVNQVAPTQELEDTYDAHTAINSAWATVKEHFGSTYYGMGSTWTNADWQERLALLANEDFAQKMEQAVANIAPVAKWSKDKISPADKAAITKERKRFELLAGASRTAQGIIGTDKSDAEIAEEMKVFAEKFSYDNENKTFGKVSPISGSQLLAALQMGVKIRAYKNKVADLGFDPDNGTHGDYQNYVTNNGVPEAGGLSMEQAKLWTQLHLGDPNVTAKYHESEIQKTQDKLAVMAHNNVISSQVKAAAAEALKPKPKPKTPTTAADTAVAKTQAADQQKFLGSPATYEGVDWFGDHVIATPDGADSWVLTYDTGLKTASITDGEINDLIDKGSLKPAKNLPKLAGADQPNLNAFKAATGVDKPTALTTPKVLNSTIKEFGGNYVGKMDVETKQKWLNHHINGDELAKYALEAAAAKQEKGAGIHKLYDVHPGSPESPAGKKSWQVLTDQMVQFGYPETPDKWTEQGLDDFLDARFGKDTFKSLKGLSQDMKTEIAKAYIASHPYLGTPSSGPQPLSTNEPQPINIGGHDITLQPGDVVFQNKNNPGIIRVIHTDGTYSAWSEDHQLYSHAPSPFSAKEFEAVGTGFNKLPIESLLPSQTPEPVSSPSSYTTSLGHNIPLEPGDVLMKNTSMGVYRAWHKDGTYTQFNAHGEGVSEAHKVTSTTTAAAKTPQDLEKLGGWEYVDFGHQSATPQVKMVPNGEHSFPLNPGDKLYEYKHDPSASKVVTHPDGTYSQWGPDGVISDHIEPYGSNFNMDTNSSYTKVDTASLPLQQQEGGPEPEKLGAPKPADILSDTWNLVNAAELPDFSEQIDKFVGDKLAGMSNAELEAQISALPPSPVQGVMKNEIAVLPAPVKKLFLWGSQGNQKTYGYIKAIPGEQEFQADQSDVLKSIAAKVAHGDYLTDDTVTWTDSKGKVWPVPVGGKVLSTGTNNGSPAFIITSPDGSGVYISATGISKEAPAYYVSNPEGYGFTSLLFENKPPLTLQNALDDGKDFGEFDWNLVANSEKAPVEKVKIATPSLATVSDSTLIEMFPTMTKVLSNDSGLSIADQTMMGELHDNASLIPDSLKKLLLADFSEKNSAGVADYELSKIVNYKLQKGHYAVPKAQNPGIDPNASYAPYITNGLTENSNIYYNWPPGAMIDYIKDFSLMDQDTLEYASGYDKATAIAEHLAKHPPGAYETSAEVETNKSSADQLKLQKISKQLGGTHSKQVYADQHGNEWMAKTFPSDPNGKSRVDIEHWANKIGQLYGFGSPETRILPELDGQYSYVQNLAPADGDLQGMYPNDLSDDMLAQAMENHVLDWLISNHDTHDQNLLRSGDKIIPIDKGQAWKFFPADKLAVGASSSAEVWYDRFYTALASGQISKEKADLIATRVLTRAQYMQKRYNSQFRQMVEAAIDKRKSWPSKYPDKNSFVDAVMARKANLTDDFEKLYKGLYAQSPHEWTIDTSKLTSHKLNDHVYVGVHQELADDVAKAATHGKALFFDSPDLEDSHVLLYTEKSQDGKTILKGETKLRKDADVLISNWLKQQTVEDKTSYSGNSYAKPVVQTHAILPMNDEIFSGLVNYAKTVSHHANDGEYNIQKVQAGEAAKAKLTEALQAVNSWLGQHDEEGALFPKTIDGNKFVTVEQQQAWLSAMGNYLKWFGQIEDAKSQGKSISALYPEAVPYKQISYTPSPGILEEQVKKDAAKAEGEVKPPTWTNTDGSKLVYDVVEKNWTQFASNGEASKHTLTPDEVADLTEDPSWKFDAGTGEEEASSEVQGSAGKMLKVIKKQNSGTMGAFNEETGDLEHHGSELHELHNGQKYEVHANDHVVEYRPWSEPGVEKSQQGLMRFSVTDWKGTTEQLEDVMDTMRSMGVDLTPADEQSLELYYWRHLRGILQDRADRNSAEWKKTLTHIEKKWTANMSSDDELKMLKDAWALSMGKDAVDNADYLPKFSRTRLHGGATDFTAGKPYWYRPDYSLADLHKVYGYKTPTHALQQPHHLPAIVASGGLWATEERLRLLGTAISGMSSSSDQGYGSAGYLFTRQNQSGHGQVYLHPQVALRTSNYSFAGDNFGDLNNRKTGSYFDLAKASGHTGGSNELMIKNGISILDDLGAVVLSGSIRNQTLARLKKEGVTEIHGIPIEEVFVLSHEAANETMKKLWQQALAEEKAQKK